MEDFFDRLLGVFLGMILGLCIGFFVVQIKTGLSECEQKDKHCALIAVPESKGEK